MRLSELMIGDWVFRKGIPSEPMQVVDFNVSKGLVFLDFQGRGVVEEIDNIAPIPLTPEILNRIGFSLEKFSDDYMKGNWWESPGFLIREDMHESIGKTISIGSMFTNYNMHLSYVDLHNLLNYNSF